MDSFDLIFFRTGIIVLFAASLLDTPKRVMPQYVNKIMVGLLGLCVFNIFIHTFAPLVLANTLNLLLAIIGLHTAYTYIEDKHDLVKYILIAGAINLIFCISQRLGFDPVFEEIPNMNGKPDVSLAGGFLGNNPRLANYFALLIPFLPVFLLPLGLVALFLTKQLVILIPLVILLFFKLRNYKSRIGLLGILGFFVILLRGHILQSLHTRFAVWVVAIKSFFDRPLLGFGLGERIIPNIDALFSSYLSFIVGVGILGLVWYGYLFYNLKDKLKNNRESIALLTLILSMAIEYQIEIIRLWYLIIAIIIMFLIKTEAHNGVHERLA